LDTFNSQYLQRHSSSWEAILAVAEVYVKLNAPISEIESTVFGVLAPEVDLDIKAALKALRFLVDRRCPRTDEFREACNARFELSTVFKTPAELAQLRAEAFDPATDDEPPEEKGKAKSE